MKSFKKTSEYSIFWARIPVSSKLKIFPFWRCFFWTNICVSIQKAFFLAQIKKLGQHEFKSIVEEIGYLGARFLPRFDLKDKKLYTQTTIAQWLKQWAYNHVLVTVVCLILLASILPNLNPCHSNHALPLKIHYNGRVYT